MPRFRNFDDLNTHLEACCAKRWAEQLRGHDQTVAATAWNGIVRFFSAFPQSPTTPATMRPAGGSSSLSLVRYRVHRLTLVPTRFRHCEVLVRGDHVHEVVISCAAR